MTRYVAATILGNENNFASLTKENFENVHFITRDNMHITEIPKEIKYLTNLTYLDLSGNQINSIPEAIGNLTNLTYLNLSRNQINSIPEAIGNLTNLDALAAYSNQINSIPEAIGNLTNLKELDLGNNKIKTIPSAMERLLKLESLSLNSNQLSGEIPSAIKNLPNLVYLDLGFNQLTGEIPESFAELPLFFISLRNNHFTSIPSRLYTLLGNIDGCDLSEQTSVTLKDKLGILHQNYQFDSFPVYEQAIDYGVSISYVLKLPDGTEKEIMPTIADGIVSISGDNLIQIGEYSLIGKIEFPKKDLIEMFSENDISGKTYSVYTTKFKIAEGIKFIKVSGNGIKEKQTSSTIALDLSKIPQLGELSKENVVIIAKTGVKEINVGEMLSLGNGKYEMSISGTWEEGAVIDVVLNKEGVLFDTDRRAVTLHKEVNNDDSNNSSDNNSNGHSDQKEKSLAPQTGDTTNTSMWVVVLLGSLGTLVFAIKKASKKN